MSMILYYSPGACSLVVHAALEMTGQPFEPRMVKLHKGEHLTPEYRAINPLGQVPALQVGGEVITQIMAITLFLDGQHPQAGLLPQDPMERAHAMALLAWLNNTVHPTFTRVFKPGHMVDGESQQADVRVKAVQTYAQQMAQLQDKVQAAAARGHGFLCGATLTVPDVYAMSVARWAMLGGLQPDQQWPALWAYARRVADQPAVARAMQRERIALVVQSPA